MFTFNYSFYCVRKGAYCQSMNCYNCYLPDVGYYQYTYDNQTQPKKRIIERFDNNGNLVERITEDC